MHFLFKKYSFKCLKCNDNDLRNDHFAELLSFSVCLKRTAVLFAVGACARVDRTEIGLCEGCKAIADARQSER